MTPQPHSHLDDKYPAQEEMFVVLRGGDTLCVVAQMDALKTDDVVFIPSGSEYPHQIINTCGTPDGTEDKAGAESVEDTRRHCVTFYDCLPNSVQKLRREHDVLTIWGDDDIRYYPNLHLDAGVLAVADPRRDMPLTWLAAGLERRIGDLDRRITVAFHVDHAIHATYHGRMRARTHRVSQQSHPHRQLPMGGKRSAMLDPFCGAGDLSRPSPELVHRRITGRRCNAPSYPQAQPVACQRCYRFPESRSKSTPHNLSTQYHFDSVAAMNSS